MSRTVLIVGVTGIAGYNTAQAMSAAGWRVLGLSRSHRYDIPGVEQVRGDVLDPESLDRALQGQEFSHVVFTTWSRQETEAENQRVNGAMLANLLAAAGRASTLEHVALVTGLKHYLGPFDAYASKPGRHAVPRDPGAAAGRQLLLRPGGHPLRRGGAAGLLVVGAPTAHPDRVRPRERDEHGRHAGRVRRPVPRHR